MLQCVVKRIRTKETKEGHGGPSEVVTAYVPYKWKSSNPAKITILYSHGNAVDLGQMLPVYK